MRGAGRGFKPAIEGLLCATVADNGIEYVEEL
jgi:hypothetical protein